MMSTARLAIHGINDSPQSYRWFGVGPWYHGIDNKPVESPERVDKVQ